VVERLFAFFTGRYYHRVTDSDGRMFEKMDERLLALMDTAAEMLEHPYSLPPLGDKLLFRIWEYPSFDTFTTWAVLKCGGGLLLRRVTWAQIRDRERFTDPMVGLRGGLHTSPDVEVTDFGFLEDEYKELLQRLKLLPLSQPETTGWVIDGVRYGFSTAERTVTWASGQASPEFEEFFEEAWRSFEARQGEHS